MVVIRLPRHTQMRFRIVHLWFLCVAVGGGVFYLQQRSIATLQIELAALHAEQGGLRAASALPSAEAPLEASGRAVDEELDRLQAEIALVRQEQEQASIQEVRGRVFSSTEVELQPKLKKRAPPRFPTKLPPDVRDGEASVSYIVDSEGFVRDVRVTGASSPEFGEAAREAVKGWEFEAAQKEGRPVNVRIELPMRFKRFEAGSPEARRPLTEAQRKQQVTNQLLRTWF